MYFNQIHADSWYDGMIEPTSDLDSKGNK